MCALLNKALTVHSAGSTLFSKNVHSTRFVTYFCEQVLPNLGTLTTLVEGLDIQLEVLKLLAEMSSFCGDMEKLETSLRKLFDKLLEYMPLPPEEAENGENAGNEEPQLQFSYVECLLYSFHQLGRKRSDFLTAKLNEKLKEFKIRLQYFAWGLQVYIRQLRLALQGKTGEALKTEESKIKVVALKITNNINVLIKDLCHIPPSCKSTVTLSWKSVQKVEIGQREPVKIQLQVHHPRSLQQDQKEMPGRFIILLVGNTAAIWATLIMSREEPSGEVEVAEVGAHEEIVVGEDSTKTSVFFSIVMSLIYLNSTTYWIAGDVPLNRLLPSAKNLMFFIPLYV
ncbi:Apoptosis inhibitor 5 [Saguinus oedipus]|uniref:Apoptosis inhibitor 5 n=1 Tax=Saguinus oedipus TaxID=9490 RepID=A0ABQ9WEN0_SAGOE|nr:Apoptosis inhibitor 5 [Saguinus oedipus]